MKRKIQLGVSMYKILLILGTPLTDKTHLRDLFSKRDLIMSKFKAVFIIYLKILDSSEFLVDT